MRNTVERVVATIFDATTSKRSPFLYTIYGILEDRATLLEDRATLYVGQTKDKRGPLGRFVQHLSDSTYLQRLSKLYRYEEVPLGKVDFVAIRFTPEKMFQTNDRVYREAVEGLVQQRLLNWVKEQKLEITIVSQTRENSYSKLPDIQKEAARISSDLESWILECHTISQ